MLVAGRHNVIVVQTNLHFLHIPGPVRPQGHHDHLRPTRRALEGACAKTIINHEDLPHPAFTNIFSNTLDKRLARCLQDLQARGKGDHLETGTGKALRLRGLRPEERLWRYFDFECAVMS